MSLEKFRKQIDKIDHQILNLLNKRARLVLALKHFKKGKSNDYYVPDREVRIYNSIIEKNKGPFPDKSVKSIFKEIISASRELQAPLKVAYWGPEATFTHLASLQHFGSSVEHIPVKSISDIFAEVEGDRCNYGVIPIENSTEGVISHTLDMFIDSDLRICAEILLRVSHNLLSKSRSLKDIKKVYTSPQPLAQTRNWIETNLPSVNFVEVSTTAEAAKLASLERGSAAIASEVAAEIYGLNILAKHIEDIPNNFTRFLVIGKKYVPKTGNDKTSILFSIKDKVGALYTMLTPFKKYKINLTSIESRPSRKKVWDYYFFIDFIGHIEDRRVNKALKELNKECLFLKILGSYPAAIKV
jgi:chorismate mutase/prephenate dehydratase